MDWQYLFVGREDEKKQLQDIYDKLEPGKPQVVSLVGETGWGKTRLIQWFYEHVMVNQGPQVGQFWPRSLILDDDIDQPRTTLVHPLNTCLGNGSTSMPVLWIGIQCNKLRDVSEVSDVLSKLKVPLEYVVARTLSESTDEEFQQVCKELGFDVGVEVAESIEKLVA